MFLVVLCVIKKNNIDLGCCIWGVFVLGVNVEIFGSGFKGVLLEVVLGVFGCVVVRFGEVGCVLGLGVEGNGGFDDRFLVVVFLFIF